MRIQNIDCDPYSNPLHSFGVYLHQFFCAEQNIAGECKRHVAHYSVDISCSRASDVEVTFCVLVGDELVGRECSILDVVIRCSRRISIGFPIAKVCL